jgi:hypothetical protein
MSFRGTFSQPSHPCQRAAFTLRAFEDADFLLELLEKDTAPVAPVAKVIEKVVEAAPPMPPPEPVIEKVTQAATVVAPSAQEILPVDLPDVQLDLPYPILFIGAFIAVSFILFAGQGGGEAAPAPSASPAPSPSPSPAPAASSTEDVDLSIPYDAAARLEYEKAGKPGDFGAFKAKYEAEAVAKVIAKKKARDS